MLPNFSLVVTFDACRIAGACVPRESLRHTNRQLKSRHPHQIFLESEAL
jgi:hypothetical protein